MAVIRYQFVASGADSVVAAYKGIGKAAEDAAVRAERAAKRMRASMGAAGAGGPGGARGGGAGAGGAAAGPAAADPRVAREKAVLREIEREQARAAREKARAEDRARKTEERERERAAKAEIKAAEATAKARAREIAKAQAKMDRAREARSESRRALMGDIGMAALGGAGAALAGTVGIIGGMTAQSMEVDEMARRVAINSRLSGGKMLDARTIRQNMYEAAGEMPGQTAQSLAQATLAFQGATGQVLDVSTLKSLATVASGAGASIEDVAEAAAALSNNMDIKGAEDMADALSVLAIQGAQGQFELKDMASLMGRISAAAAGANVDKSVRGVSQVGALAQIARRGGGSAEQATTSIENVFRAMTSHADMFKKSGIDVFVAGTKNRQLRNTNDVLVESFKKTEGDKTKLGKMFGAQADPIINILSAKFDEEMMRSKDLNKAGEAVRKELEEAAKVTSARTTIEEAAAAAQQSTAARMSAAWENATGKVTDKILPALANMFNKFEQSGAIDAITDAFEFAADVISENMGAIADLAESLGFEKKKPSLAKQLETAEAKKAKLEKQFAELDPETRMSSEQGQRIAAEHMAAKQEVDRIKGEMFKPVSQLGGVDIKQKFFTREKFVSALMETKGPKYQKTEAEAIYDAIRKDPGAYRDQLMSNEQNLLANALGDETAFLQNYRRPGEDYLKQFRQADKPMGEVVQTTGKSTEYSQAFEQLVVAANGAATALNTVGAAGKANVTGSPGGV